MKSSLRFCLTLCVPICFVCSCAYAKDLYMKINVLYLWQSRNSLGYVKGR